MAGQDAASALRDLDVLAGKELLELLLERRHRLLDDHVVLRPCSPPQTIRLIVPGALPSISTSRG